jgi:Mg/Co/Ni transporter MgtE
MSRWEPGRCSMATPLHVLGQEPAAKQRQVGQFLVQAAERLENFGSYFASLHSRIWEEVRAMAKRKKQGLEVDFRPVADLVGLDKLIENIGKKEILEQIGKKEILEQIGKKEILEQIGKKEVLEHLDVDDLLANLNAAKRRELKRRLQAEFGSS